MSKEKGASDLKDFINLAVTFYGLLFVYYIAWVKEFGVLNNSWIEKLSLGLQYYYFPTFIVPLAIAFLITKPKIIEKEKVIFNFFFNLSVYYLVIFGLFVLLFTLNSIRGSHFFIYALVLMTIVELVRLLIKYFLIKSKEVPEIRKAFLDEIYDHALKNGRIPPFGEVYANVIHSNSSLLRRKILKRSFLKLYKEASQYLNSQEVLRTLGDIDEAR